MGGLLSTPYSTITRVPLMLCCVLLASPAALVVLILLVVPSCCVCACGPYVAGSNSMHILRHWNEHSASSVPCLPLIRTNREVRAQHG
jgi:hypothetical protein